MTKMKKKLRDYLPQLIVCLGSLVAFRSLLPPFLRLFSELLVLSL